MANDTSEPDDKDLPHPKGALLTRDVFLDTEALKRFGFDTGKPSIVALLGHIAAQRLQLHFTDITLSEIRRQIGADAEKAVEEIKRARSTAAKWRRRAPDALGSGKKLATPIDAEAVGLEAFQQFRQSLGPFTEHHASRQAGTEIFKAYFAREAPFDGQGGKSVKEFPDAFVISALADWCRDQNTLMYVVTSDKAMLRAAKTTEKLVPVGTLDSLLQIVTVEHSPDVVESVEAILDHPDFEAQLASAIDRSLGDLAVVYMGDFSEGEASDPARLGEPSVVDWTVISAFGKGYGLIVEFDVELLVQVHFDDLSMASYDNEDGIYIGSEPGCDEVKENVRLRMFIQIDEDCLITRAEMLTTEVKIYDPYDNYE